VITGPPGVGKTALAEEIYDQLAGAGVPHAVVDLDALCLSYPFPPGDNFNEEIALTNLRDVWRNYARNGAQRLVLARVVESRSYLDRLRNVLPDPQFVVCRLTAGDHTLEQRLRTRETGSSLDSLLKRASYLSLDPWTGLDGRFFGGTGWSWLDWVWLFCWPDPACSVPGRGVSRGIGFVVVGAGLVVLR